MLDATLKRPLEKKSPPFFLGGFFFPPMGGVRFVGATANFEISIWRPLIIKRGQLVVSII